MHVEQRIEALYARYGSQPWPDDDDPDVKPGKHRDLYAHFTRLNHIVWNGFRHVEASHPQEPKPSVVSLANGPANLALLRQLIGLEAELGIAVPLVQMLLREVLALPLRSRRDRVQIREIVTNTRELEAPDMRRAEAIERTLLHACSPVLQMEDRLFEPTPKLVQLYTDHVAALRELRDEVVSYANGWADTLDAVVNIVRWMEPEVTSMGEVDLLHHSEFERLVADLLDRDGYRVVRWGGGAGDQGADVLAVDELGRYIMVQCKHFRDGNGSVGQQVVQHLYGGATTLHPSTLPIVVTNGRITGGAKVWAEENDKARLVGRDELKRWAEDGKTLAEVVAR